MSDQESFLSSYHTALLSVLRLLLTVTRLWLSLIPSGAQQLGLDVSAGCEIVRETRQPRLIQSVTGQCWFEGSKVQMNSLAARGSQSAPGQLR